MSRSGYDFGGPAKQRSGWLIPLAVLVVTVVLAALVLAYYFAPTPPELVEEHPSPTDTTGRVTLSVGAMNFRIPANYVLYRSARRGGPLDQVELVALLPDLHGYTPSEAQAFTSNAPDSDAVHILLRKSAATLTEKDRLTRVYLVQTTSTQPAAGPYGLKQYTFRPETGYRDDDLLVGDSDFGVMTLRCTRPSPVAPAPNCLREILIGPGVALVYRFKRTHLAQWRAIDTGMRKLAASFARKNQRAP